MPNEENEENKTPVEGEANTAEATQTQQTNTVTDAELQAKAQKKANLDKAIEEAEEILRKKREAAKEPIEEDDEDEEEEEAGSPSTKVKIDFTDPAAKAWDKHIQKSMDPLAQGREAEKAEIRKFTIKEFLGDKPALARDPEKVKELVDMYDRVKSNTGLTKEGVLLDLNRAFGALYHEQLIDAAKTQKFEKVREAELFSDAGVDKGATGYVNEKQKMPNLSNDDLKILSQWGMTPDQWFEMQQNTSKEI